MPHAPRARAPPGRRYSIRGPHRIQGWFCQVAEQLCELAGHAGRLKASAAMEQASSRFGGQDNAAAEEAAAAKYGALLAQASLFVSLAPGAPPPVRCVRGAPAVTFMLQSQAPAPPGSALPLSGRPVPALAGKEAVRLCRGISQGHEPASAGAYLQALLRWRRTSGKAPVGARPRRWVFLPRSRRRWRS